MKTLDVRPLIARGEEPFDAIMGVVATLEPGEEFELTAPLEPVPLYHVLGARGFSHETEDLGGGDYRVLFRIEGGGTGPSAAEPVVGRGLDLAHFAGEGFGRRILFGNDRVRVVLAAFEPGQEIAVHAPQVDLVMSILEGVGEVRAGGQVHWVKAGDLAIVPAGTARGVRARTRMVALHVVSPPPTEADHRRVEEAAAWPAPASAPDVASLILEEHGHLFPRLEELGSLAADIGSLEETDLRRRLEQVLGFLSDGLLPHAQEEERSIYPAVDGVLRAVGRTTRTMTADHTRIRALIEALRTLAGSPQSQPARNREQALLYGLQAILELHFTKENEEYVPLLDLLPAEEKERLHRHLAGNPETT